MDKKKLLKHFTNPKNYGKPQHFSHFGVAENKDCGDKIEIFIVVENGTIKQVNFEAKACALATASASVLCEQAENKTIADLRSYSKEEIFGLIGGVPKKSRENCATLILEAVRNLAIV